jgi:DNA-binding NarL/FixJ family response regulator
MRCLVIDDERLARKELMRLLAAETEVELVGEAVSQIEQHEPDLRTVLPRQPPAHRQSVAHPKYR